MDARSIAATAANKGFLTSAENFTGEYRGQKYFFDKTIYDNRVFDSKGVADPSVEIQFGPNIKDWPKMPALAENPLDALPELKPVMEVVNKEYPEAGKGNLGVGSTIFAVKPGDGSAREQAASCQKVLGGWANIANEYATKRYRSNLINWGMLPFLIPAGDLPFVNGDYLFFPEIRKAVEEKADSITGYVVKESGLVPFTVTLGELTDDEREIILKGCLINYNRK